MNLDEIRVEIDRLDREIVALLVKRMEVTRNVAAYKQAHDLPIYQPEREKAVIEKISALAGEEYAPYLAAIYQNLMDESKNYQKSWLAEHENKASEQ